MQAPRRKRQGRGASPAQGGDTRGRLLDAALQVFDDHGWAGYTVHAVVAESGLSLGTLYHHFGSMDGLSAALYSRCMGSLLDAIGDALEGKRTARAAVEAVVRSYLAFTERERAAAMFIHASPSSGALASHAEAIAAEKAPRMERIAGVVRAHVRAGAIVAMPEPLLEMMIIGPVAEVARRWLAGVPGIDLDEAARLLPERVWRSVRA